jgi:hypothetical protein
MSRKRQIINAHLKPFSNKCQIILQPKVIKSTRFGYFNFYALANVLLGRHGEITNKLLSQ